MGIFEEAREEEALRAHIRRLLYDYAKEHLTTSYIEFTEQAVTELLSQSLRIIPTTDSSSVRLPEEPFSALTRLYALDDLEPYDEEVIKSSDVMKYIKSFLATLKQGSKLPSQRAVDEGDYECCMPEDRLIPMLSRRARRETPRPGLNDFRQSLKTPFPDLLKSSDFRIMPVDVRPVKEPVISFDKILNVTWSLLPETGTQVRNLLKTTATLSRPGPSFTNRYLNPSTRPDSPPLQIDAGPPFFVPIFSRKERPRSGRTELKGEQKETKEGQVSQLAMKKHLFGDWKDKAKIDVNVDTDVKDLFALGCPPRSIAQVAPKLNLAEVDEDEEPDLLKENMKIVDGWQTYHSSSPALAPSRASSLSSVTTPQSSQEIDELNMNLTVSSPNTDLSSIDLLKDTRMDLPAMPRSKRNILGERSSTGTKNKKIGAKQSYASFLLSTLAPRKMTRPEESLPSPRNDERSSPILDFDDEPATTSPKSQIETEIESAAKADVDDTVSVAGEAGSTVGLDSVAGVKGTGNVLNDDSFESELRAIFRNTDADPLGLIMREKLDPMKDGKEMLMEVPKLPPPNEHPPNNDVLFLASNLRQYVVPSGAGTNKDREKSNVYQYMKKAKGIASVTLELSWVPFAVTTLLPTNEEILNVHDFIEKNTEMLNTFDRLGMTKERGLARIKEIIEQAGERCSEPRADQVLLEKVGPSQVEHILEEWACHVDQVTSRLLYPADEGKIDIVLSKEERRRLKGLERIEKVELVVNEGVEMTERSGELEKQASHITSEEGTSAHADHFEGVPPVDDYQTHCSPPVFVPPAPNIEQPFALTPDGVTPPQAYDPELFPRSETDFGIPYFLPDDENNVAFYGYGRDFPEDNQPLPGMLAAAPEPGEYPYTNQCGFDFAEEHGFDSDKENEDPSVAVPHDAVSEFNHPEASFDLVRGESRFFEAEDSRLAKRPRLEWEGDHIYQGQRHSYIDAGPAVEDSGIELLDYLSCSPGPEGSKPSFNSAQVNRDSCVTYQAPLVSVEDDHDCMFDEERSDGRRNINLTQYQESDFVPLAFDSQPILDSQFQQPLSPSALIPVRSPPAALSLSEAVPFTIPFHDHTIGIAEFARLRAKKLRTPPSVPEAPTPSTVEAGPLDGSIASKTAPDVIFDRNTLRLPAGDRTLPTTAHWYMASMALLQKQALVRTLRSEACGVGLVERDNLTGVDLVIDSHTAVIFTNLLALPSQIDALINTICEQSWRYDHLLVVFEAFVPAIAFKPDSAMSAKESLSAYSPPTLKAIKKFRRDVSLAEACENKREGCRVITAFADTVLDAAMLARIFGDEAESRTEDPVELWGDRAWLDDGVGEDEENLAAADGMNHFAACVILCQISLDEFMEISPEDRMVRFGPQVGRDRMVKLNDIINIGRQVVE